MCEVDIVLDIIMDDTLHSSQWWNKGRKGRNDRIEIESDDKSCTDCCQSIVDIVDPDHRESEGIGLSHRDDIEGRMIGEVVDILCFDRPATEDAVGCYPFKS